MSSAAMKSQKSRRDSRTGRFAPMGQPSAGSSIYQLSMSRGGGLVNTGQLLPLQPVGVGASASLLSELMDGGVGDSNIMTQVSVKSEPVSPPPPAGSAGDWSPAVGQLVVNSSPQPRAGDVAGEFEIKTEGNLHSFQASPCAEGSHREEEDERKGRGVKYSDVLREMIERVQNCPYSNRMGTLQALEDIVYQHQVEILAEVAKIKEQMPDVENGSAVCDIRLKHVVCALRHDQRSLNEIFSNLQNSQHSKMKPVLADIDQTGEILHGLESCAEEISLRRREFCDEEESDTQKEAKLLGFHQWLLGSGDLKFSNAADDSAAAAPGVGRDIGGLKISKPACTALFHVANNFASRLVQEAQQLKKVREKVRDFHGSLVLHIQRSVLSSDITLDDIQEVERKRNFLA